VLLAGTTHSLRCFGCMAGCACEAARCWLHCGTPDVLLSRGGGVLLHALPVFRRMLRMEHVVWMPSTAFSQYLTAVLGPRQSVRTVCCRAVAIAAGLQCSAVRVDKWSSLQGRCRVVQTCRVVAACAGAAHQVTIDMHYIHLG
jgi:hypothetical protein